MDFRENPFILRLLLGFVAANEASWMITFLWKKLLDCSHFTRLAKSQTMVFWLNLVP